MTGPQQPHRKKAFTYWEAVLIIIKTEKLKCTELTSFSAGDDTVIIT